MSAGHRIRNLLDGSRLKGETRAQFLERALEERQALAREVEGLRAQLPPPGIAMPSNGMLRLTMPMCVPMLGPVSGYLDVAVCQGDALGVMMRNLGAAYVAYVGGGS